MLRQADLGIAVIGCEGASTRTLLASDIVVHRIEDALGFLLETTRFKARYGNKRFVLSADKFYTF